VIPHHDERGGFFTLLVQPQREVADSDVVPRELIFVLDTSGSMRGFPLDKSKEAMRRLLDGMRPGDTFNVVRFAGDTGTLWPKPMPYTDDNAREAMRFVDAMRGSGGTEMRRGIVEALSQAAEEGMLRIAFLLTDGYVGDEERILRAIEETRRGARVFTLGVGSSVNRYLLDRAATVGLGEAFYVRQDEDSTEVIDRFFSRVDRPALAHVTLDWGGLDVSSVYPPRVPDLWAGQPIRVHGRYAEGGSATVTISGQLGSTPYRQQIQVTLPREPGQYEAIASVWARHKIKFLMLEKARLPSRDVVEEITGLGLEFRLMTQWTSFVAVEEKVVNVDGTPQTVVQPVEMPEDVSYEGVFGDQGPAPARRAKVSARTLGIAPPATAEVASRVGPESSYRLAMPDATPQEPEPLHQPTQVPGSRAEAQDEEEAASGVELKTVAVRGGLRQPDVVRVLKTALPALRRAYRTRLAAAPGLSGRLMVTLVIAGDGSVNAVAFDADSLSDQQLRQAVGAILARLGFGTVAGGGEARVSLELELEVEG
jgi:Ca-activated chloride channel family protein